MSEKALVLADEFLQQVENNGEKFIKEENQELAFWMMEAYRVLVQLNGQCLIYVGFVQSQSEVESFEKVTRNALLLNHFKSADAQIDFLIQQVQQDKISP